MRIFIKKDEQMGKFSMFDVNNKAKYIQANWDQSKEDMVPFEGNIEVNCWIFVEIG